jgi:hypothetical protein
MQVGAVALRIRGADLSLRPDGKVWLVLERLTVPRVEGEFQHRRVLAASGCPVRESRTTPLIAPPNERSIRKNTPAMMNPYARSIAVPATGLMDVLAMGLKISYSRWARELALITPSRIANRIPLTTLTMR